MTARTATAFALLTLLAGCPAETQDSTLTVVGTVVTLRGEPIPLARVAIPGHPAQLTDATGRFSVAGVTPPYDVVAVASADGWDRVSIYVGLTGSSPVVAVEAQGTARGTTASGSLAEFSAPGGSITSGVVCSPEVSGYGLILDGGGAFSTAFPIGWEGPTESVASLFALQYTADAGGLPTAYEGLWGLGGVRLVDGGAVSSLSLARGLAATQTVATTITDVPSGYTVSYADPAVALSPDCGIRLPFLSAPGSAFDYVAPSIAGATFQVAVTAENAAHDSVTSAVSLPTGETALAVALPEGISIGSPGIADTLTPATSFDWTAGVGGAYLLRLYPAVATQSIRLVTAERHATLARLADAGIALAAGDDYAWSLTTLPFASVDGVATREALRPVELIRSGHVPHLTGAWAQTNARRIVVPVP